MTKHNGGRDSKMLCQSSRFLCVCPHSQFPPGKPIVGTSVLYTFCAPATERTQFQTARNYWTKTTKYCRSPSRNVTNFIIVVTCAQAWLVFSVQRWTSEILRSSVTVHVNVLKQSVCACRVWRNVFIIYPPTHITRGGIYDWAPKV